MAKCEKCDGNGWKDNPRYLNAKAKYQTDWYLQYEPRINCRACKGTGYVIGDIKDAVNILKVYKNNPQSITNKEFKQAIEILERIFDDGVGEQNNHIYKNK